MFHAVPEWRKYNGFGILSHLKNGNGPVAGLL